MAASAACIYIYIVFCQRTLEWPHAQLYRAGPTNLTPLCRVDSIRFIRIFKFFILLDPTGITTVWSLGAIVGRIRMHTRPDKYFPVIVDKRAQGFLWHWFIRIYTCKLYAWEWFFLILLFYSIFCLTTAIQFKCLAEEQMTHKRFLFNEFIIWKTSGEIKIIF